MHKIKTRNDEEKNNIFVFSEAFKRGYITKKGNLVLSTQLMIPNYSVILSHRGSIFRNFLKKLTPF